MDVIDVRLLLHRRSHTLAKTSVCSSAGNTAKPRHGASGLGMEPVLLPLELLPEISFRFLECLDEPFADDL